MRSVELFTGAGGMALGTSSAGFKHLAVVEWDKDACDSIRANQARGLAPLTEWPLTQGDVRQFDFSAIASHSGELDLVAGGPPCQPFSLGGKHKGYLDARDMFPEAVRAVRELQPRAFIFENVRGLVRPVFFNYFHYVLLQLEFPDIKPKKSETWPAHYTRLQEYKFSGRTPGLHYKVQPKLLNAVNFGVPQKRERVFIVGFRSDLGIEWSFPEEGTHTQDALLYEQWVTGEYWDRHRVTKRQRPTLTDKVARRVQQMKAEDMRPQGLAWRTVRDAIHDLPDPRSKEATSILNHRFQPGARPYHGHTGSPLDEPAKALKAGDHGVPGGENMLCMPDGSVRYFTVRESARLQRFPDDYLFQGSWSETMRQLGNAVPVTLAETVASSVAACLSKQKKDEKHRRH